MISPDALSRDLSIEATIRSNVSAIRASRNPDSLPFQSGYAQGGYGRSQFQQQYSSAPFRPYYNQFPNNQFQQQPYNNYYPGDGGHTPDMYRTPFDHRGHISTKGVGHILNRHLPEAAIKSNFLLPKSLNLGPSSNFHKSHQSSISQLSFHQFRESSTSQPSFSHSQYLQPSSNFHQFRRSSSSFSKKSGGDGKLAAIQQSRVKQTASTFKQSESAATQQSQPPIRYIIQRTPSNPSTPESSKTNAMVEFKWLPGRSIEKLQLLEGNPKMETVSLGTTVKPRRKIADIPKIFSRVIRGRQKQISMATKSRGMESASTELTMVVTGHHRRQRCRSRSSYPSDTPNLDHGQRKPATKKLMEITTDWEAKGFITPRPDFPLAQ